LENIHSARFGTENGYRDDVGLGVKGVPQQFSDACEWLGWARKSIKLVGVNLHDEAFGHRGDARPGRKSLRLELMGIELQGTSVLIDSSPNIFGKASWGSRFDLQSDRYRGVCTPELVDDRFGNVSEVA
jgi:hypothetical protein